MQHGIIMPGKKNFDPSFRMGEGVYWITDAKVPDMANLPKTGKVKASLTLTRTWVDDTTDECIQLDWMVAEDGQCTTFAPILKRLLSLNANSTTDDEGNPRWMTPAEIMANDFYPVAEELDGLTVVADLKEGKQWVDKITGKVHNPVACFNFRAPTVEEGYRLAQKTQYYAMDMDDGKVVEYALYEPDVGEP